MIICNSRFLKGPGQGQFLFAFVDAISAVTTSYLMPARRAEHTGTCRAPRSNWVSAIRLFHGANIFAVLLLIGRILSPDGYLIISFHQCFARYKKWRCSIRSDTEFPKMILIDSLIAKSLLILLSNFCCSRWRILKNAGGSTTR